MIKTAYGPSGDLCVHIEGRPYVVCSEVVAIIYEAHRQMRHVLGKEEADILFSEIVKVIEPGSEMRKTAKQSINEARREMAKKAKGEK